MMVSILAVHFLCCTIFEGFRSECVTEILNGIISSDLTLTETSSPYCLTQTILIQNNSILTIEAGVVLNMCQQCSIDCDSGSSIYFLGEQGNEILVTGIEKTRGYWSRISFGGGENPILKHTIFEYGGDLDETEMIFFGYSLESAEEPQFVENCSFSNSHTYAIHVEVNSTFRNCQFYDVENGIRVTNPTFNESRIDFVLTESTFDNIDYVGVYSSGYIYFQILDSQFSNVGWYAIEPVIGYRVSSWSAPSIPDIEETSVISNCSFLSIGERIQHYSVALSGVLYVFVGKNQKEAVPTLEISGCTFRQNLIPSIYFTMYDIFSTVFVTDNSFVGNYEDRGTIYFFPDPFMSGTITFRNNQFCNPMSEFEVYEIPEANLIVDCRNNSWGVDLDDQVRSKIHEDLESPYSAVLYEPFLPTIEYPQSCDYCDPETRSQCVVDEIGVIGCTCPDGYFPPLECNEFNCNGMNDCSGHGTCVSSLEDKRVLCLCDSQYFGTNCSVFECFGVLSNDSDVNMLSCSDNGECIGPDDCSCFSQDFYGENCENQLFYCNGESELEEDIVCSGNGACVGEDSCICEEEFDGEWCQNDDEVKRELSLGIVIVIIVICAAITCFSWVSCCCLLSIGVVVAFLVCFLWVYKNQGYKNEMNNEELEESSDDQFII